MRLGELGAELTGTDDGRPAVVLLHGLTFDRAMWTPLVNALEGRRALALDLPGHGESSPRDSYDLHEVADVLHTALLAADVHTPVLVGHSIGGVLATVYAGNHPARAVLNIDQPLLPGPFGELLRSVEPVLRGPEYLSVWIELLAGMGTEHLSPQMQILLRSNPRQDLLLGYWREILETPPARLHEQRTRELTALRGSGTAYHHVSRTAMALDYQEWLRKVLPEAEFTVLPGGGHFPHIAQPGALVAIVSGWE